MKLMSCLQDSFHRREALTENFKFHRSRVILNEKLYFSIILCCHNSLHLQIKVIAALTSLKARLVSNDPYEIPCGSRETKTRVHHWLSVTFFSFEARACQVYEDVKKNKQTHVPISVAQHHTSNRLKTGNVLVNPNDVIIANTHSVMYMYISESL